jgi:molybdate transport system substrate-binding protein
MQRRNSAAAVRLAVVTLLIGMAPAGAADIVVFSSGAPAAVQKVIAPQFTQATGHRVLITAETINLMMKRLTGGEQADVVVLPRPPMEKFGEQGALRAGTLVNVARVGVGVAIREGAPRPDVSTPDALRKTLLAAKSVAHPDPKGGGFAGVQIVRMFERLGIAEAMKPKARLMFAFSGGVAAVAKGDVEIGLFNMSEIVPVKGVTLAGPLPPELQSYITFAAAVHARAAAPGPAQEYLRALIAPAAGDAWTKGGMEPLGGK